MRFGARADEAAAARRRDILFGVGQGALFAAVALAVLYIAFGTGGFRRPHAPAPRPVAVAAGLPAPAPAIERHLDFGSVSAPADVTRVAAWAVREADNGDRPFAVVDKRRAQVYVFEPGGRTYWHKHEVAQVLFVTAGEGRLQSADGTGGTLRPGDVAHIPAGEVHWHGAAPGSLLVHVAVSVGKTEWMHEVSDEEYAGGFAAAPGADRRTVVAHSAFAGGLPRLPAARSSSIGACAIEARNDTTARGKNISA